MKTDKMAPSDVKEYNARMAEYFEDVNEQRFPSEYRSDKDKAVRMAVATIAAVIAVVLASYGFHVANERMASDPMEVVE